MSLQNVNTTDIADAIRLGCRTMCNVFDADDDFRPFFESTIRPVTRLAFSPYHSESHVPGRHLNALLTAEDTLGLALDEQAIAYHARAAFFSYGGPLPLPLNRATQDGPLINFYPHNVREGFHALYALVRYRHDARARQLAEASIDWITRHWHPETGWDQEAIAHAGLRYLVFEDTFITGIARAIGPLVKYYRATGYAPALALAVTLGDEATRHYFLPNGVLDRARFGSHAHSVTSTLSGLAQLADLLEDWQLLHRVQAFYDYGLWEMRDALGWVVENTDRQGDSADVGEINCTGDIVETALILGRHGFPAYYQDAERILRAHLLPSQVRDTSFIVNPPNPDGVDGLHEVAERHLGAFGFPAPYGHRAVGCDWVSFNMDIVGGAVGSLCEAYRAIVRHDSTGVWVNLHFDHATPEVTVTSPYPDGALRVTMHTTAPLWVRLPDWTPADAVCIEGSDAYQYVNGHLFFPHTVAGDAITITYPLVEQELTLYHLARDIRVRLRGDAVAAMENFGVDLTFFPPIV